MRSGFSLIELVVVLLILGIAGAVMAPHFTHAEDDQLDEAIAELTGLISAARSAAVERGANVRLAVTPATGEWWLIADRAQPPLLRHGTLPRPLPAKAGSNAADIEYRFTPAGAVAGNAVDLDMDDAGAVLVVDRWTGRVHVRETRRLRTD